MSKTKLGIVVILMIAMVIALMPGMVQADSFKFGAKADKTSLKEGDTVTITLSVGSINAGELGINTFEAMLSYDKNIFEEVTESDFSPSNKWSITYNGNYSTNAGKILGMILSSGVKEDQTVGTLKLKVKSGVGEISNTTVKLTEITTNNGSDLITDTDKEINFKIIKATSEEPKKDDDKIENGNKGDTSKGTDSESSSNSGLNSGSGTSSSTDSKSGNTTKKISVLPYTGTIAPIMLIGMPVLAILARVAYRRYKTIDR